MRPRTLRILLIAVLAAGIAAALWHFSERPDSPGVSSRAKPIAHAPAAPAGAAVPGRATREFREAGTPALVAVSPLPVAEAAERSPLADSLHAPEQSGMQDLQVVLDLFAHYREKFGGLPSGEDNAQIVNALTGNNPLRLALIERAHPAINRSGELTDRWGTPFFFHLISRDALEIRSGGADRTLWSDDDLLIQSPSLRQRPPAP